MLKIHSLMALAVAGAFGSGGYTARQHHDVSEPAQRTPAKPTKPLMQHKAHDAEIIAKAQAKRDRKAERNRSTK